ncbi:flagellar biosynthesis protein FliQ [Caldibacillus thermolactis]|jgi:flagellar biosynthesis protein FliQ|uniref:Flagellar biosynthetic protein FliQ n=1 Tax=Pallidibacillus thermolactis TaxID=251051 RepID=A0ABT2WBL1_9BACI|nr:flagellar biosynthesis protein FliQ [Pallidibacillus thermolactis]MCU9593079.1 flagellar biosynthesis protein FliQ [Pallidibacillus thermolactis]MCU9600157.1 flagellar biosynthesis protein FliQ [Pallidibacillus thermolactis subsp. kokeshiiformis]MED1672020.1 flagellar biosynthesis protein FliQ [Pallidibacillus thermolactis subsp. kokeshiiformis]
MNSEEVIALAEQGILTILLVAGPLLAIALGIGLIVSILQATTQIQEQTLAFIPKIVAVLLGIVVLAPWMINHMVQFATEIFANLTKFVG